MNKLTLLIVILATTAPCSAEPFNYAEYWKNLPPEARSAYYEGALDGINFAFDQAAAEWLPKDERYLTRYSTLAKRVFPQFKKDTLLPVMMDLYRDPTNAFLDPLTVLILSRDKLSGSDIAVALVDARKRAIERYELNRKIRSQ